jgi:hypothetical protein|tara:strand:- start:224 stop:529 length:306 start_codon:yes stop_codon:yes gene_type:complete
MSLKALMIVSGIFGYDGDYTTKMPSMDECFKQKQVVETQQLDINVTCVPRFDEKIDSDKFYEMMEMFLSVITRMKEDDRDYCYDNPFDGDCLEERDVERLR